VKKIKQTKSNLRIRRTDREDFYLNLVVGSSVELVAPNGNILGSVRCLSKNVVAMKMHGDEGWNIQSSNGKQITNQTLGTLDADKFVKEAEKSASQN